MMRENILIIFLFFSYTHTMAQDKIIRKDLLTANLGNKAVTEVQIKEITLQPSQEAGLHLHPCPVTGYIAEGEIRFQVKGKQVKILHAGDAFYEPAETEIIHFDNASDFRPAKFIAFYLLNGRQDLIQMLPQNK
jgi:quercetin dioxygenase-like cupin family protein